MSLVSSAIPQESLPFPCRKPKMPRVGKAEKVSSRQGDPNTCICTCSTSASGEKYDTVRLRSDGIRPNHAGRRHGQDG